MSSRLRVLSIAGAVTLVTALSAGTALADPAGAKFSRRVIADCGGTQVSMVTNGNGDWHSGHDLNSTAVFVPVAIEDSGVFIDPAGGQHPFSHSLEKGSASPNGQPIVTCSFAVDTMFPDGSRLVANGTLTGFFS